MYKTTRSGSNIKELYFTDDGFAMGIVFCLTVLKQTRKYNQLRWKDSVAIKHRHDTQSLNVQQEARAVKDAVKAKQRKEDARQGSSMFGFGGTKREIEEEDDYEDLEEVTNCF